MCSVENCGGDASVKGLCKKHYQRMKRNGSPETLRGRGAKKKHGMINTPEYYSWGHMKARCGNPNHQHYARYGGRGIRVCARWLNSFTAFYEDMGRKPGGGHSIDRIDNDGDYEPSNCRWATQSEQCSNKASTVLHTYNGKSQTVMQWATEYGMNYMTLHGRLNRYGYSIGDALTVGIHQRKRK